MEKKSRRSRPELWGGIECTINRIGNKYRDQLAYAHHFERPSDLSKIAELGISKMRYPVLWESHQFKSRDEKINWERITEKLQHIVELGIEPIAGLVHHGSGPEFTSLSDKKFGEKLSEYAYKVAQQFPHIKYYTPVNEPLTTARFSGLYGFWYPHYKDPRHFCNMFVNQLKAIVLSMKEIRKVVPGAMLVQTEDLTKIQCSRGLKYQATFENHRRWLTYDFLCGAFTPTHPLWNYFISMGISKKELSFFLDNPCVPDIAGFNYYVTSERFLDKNIKNWPGLNHDGNGVDRYVDVEAVRAVKPFGLEYLLKEAWNRYKIPLALTEVHLNCTREEQLRWFKEAWDIAQKVNNEGIPVYGVTAWSLLGAFDWNSLLTLENHRYEPGVFDITNNELRPTAISSLLQSFSHKNKYDHPLLSQQGWWHYSYKNQKRDNDQHGPNPLIIVGGNGTLGNAFKKICERRSIPYIAVSRPEYDITKINSFRNLFEKYKPWAVINATGYVKVDEAEIERDICYSLNVSAAVSLASLCNQMGIQLMSFSSDLVFNGDKELPYFENDKVAPLNFYGFTKAEAEEKIRGHFPHALVIRSSSFFGPWDKYNFAYKLIDQLQNKNSFKTANNISVSPTYIPHLVDASLDLLIDKETGIWHITNDGNTSWSGFAEQLAERGGFSKKYIIDCPQHEMNWKAMRPSFSALQSQKGIKLPTLQNAIECFFEEKIN